MQCNSTMGFLLQAALCMWAVLALSTSLWLHRLCCCAVHPVQPSLCILMVSLRSPETSFPPPASTAVAGLPWVEMVDQVLGAFLGWYSSGFQWDCTWQLEEVACCHGRKLRVLSSCRTLKPSRMTDSSFFTSAGSARRNLLLFDTPWVLTTKTPGFSTL